MPFVLGAAEQGLSCACVGITCVADVFLEDQVMATARVPCVKNSMRFLEVHKYACNAYRDDWGLYRDYIRIIFACSLLTSNKYNQKIAAMWASPRYSNCPERVLFAGSYYLWW